MKPNAISLEEELKRLYKQNIALVELLKAQNELIKCFIEPKNSPELNLALGMAVESIDRLTKPTVIAEPYDANKKTKRFFEPRHNQ